MIVRNFLEAPYQVQSVHEGKGLGKNAKVFSAEDFDTPLKFIYYTQMEPGASIGVHPHGENEEVYVVLAGDIIVNKPGWRHGIENTSDEPLKLFVFEVDKR